MPDPDPTPAPASSNGVPAPRLVNPIIPKLLYSYAEVSAATGLHIRTIKRLAADGIIATVKIGRRKLISVGGGLARVVRMFERTARIG